jgi:hypothetical protein
MTQPVDTLSGLAPLLRVRPELLQLCRFGAQWSSDHSSEAEGWAPFHFVTQGTCIIELSGRSIPLSAGDVAVLPRGRRHSVRGADDAGWRAWTIRHPLEFPGRRRSQVQYGWRARDEARLRSTALRARAVQSRACGAARGYRSFRRRERFSCIPSADAYVGNSGGARKRTGRRCGNRHLPRERTVRHDRPHSS